ncbi:MAG: hypothetical protein Ct9H300mP14_08330 [Gammaproteobacteria bacterium]|nr:MAG: hypothetical protein Ct9H300mP14_08330 [Gammaproteobacteria bacterium]
MFFEDLFEHVFQVPRSAGHRRGSAGQRSGAGDDLLGFSFGDNFSAVNASAGAQVDDMIRTANGLFVMFYNNNSVSKVTQPVKGFEKSSLSR